MTRSIEAVLQQGFIQGYMEVLGKDLFCEILDSDIPDCLQEANLSLNKPLDPVFFQRLDENMLQKYGKQGAEGIARSAGRLAFKGYQYAIPTLIERGSIEKRLLPLAEKIGNALQDLLHELNALKFSNLNLKRNTEENIWLVDGTFLQPEGIFLQAGNQQFFMGMLESMLEWMDSRHQFQVEQSTAPQNNGELHLKISVRRLD